MKSFNLFFTVIFFIFAALQYNDPDPYVWIPIYGSMTALCVSAIFRTVNKWIYLFLALIFLIYAASLFPSMMVWLRSDDRSQLLDELAKMQNLYIEETREFLGLVICLVVLTVNYVAQYFNRP